MRARCQNCGYVDDVENLPAAKDVAERHSLGDIFSDVECPECGALCFPIEEIELRAGEDYKLPTTPDTTTWFTIGNLSLVVAVKNDGVKVELYPLLQEDGEPLAYAHALFEDGAPELQGGVGDATDHK